MKVLITGGAGFIGSNFIRYFMKEYDDYKIMNFDKLTYAGNLKSLADVEHLENYEFFKGDISERSDVEHIFTVFKPDAIINFAAESHVDRSIEGSAAFIKTNIQGTHVLLEAARKFGLDTFLQISTDEVYGSIKKGKFFESDILKPSSPYSSSKASADLIALSYFVTYKTNVKITRCSNNYGPYQYPEKLIPLLITNGFEGKKFPIYKEGLNVRDWIFVEDHCRAIDLVFHRGEYGNIYNVGGNCEKKNIEIATLIANEIVPCQDVIEFVNDRLGHDFRYAVDFSKLRTNFNWYPKVNFETGIKQTIDWYKSNEDWWKPLK